MISLSYPVRDRSFIIKVELQYKSEFDQIIEASFSDEEQESLNQLTNPPEFSRLLTEVDNLNRFRQSDGSYPDEILQDIYTNLLTAAYESAVPNGVSRIEQTHHEGRFYWLGQDEIEVAKSGYKWHEHAAALRRVDIEVDEAKDARDKLAPGWAKVVISPRMTEKDAPREIAEAENLANEDMIRIHYLRIGSPSEVKGKLIESIRVTDVPLSAWVDMLEDSGNIFGKSIKIDDKESAESVMRAHREMYIPLEQLPEGPVTLLKEARKYADEVSQKKIDRQLKAFEVDQEQLRRDIEPIAERWLKFEVELAESLYVHGYATQEIHRFIADFEADINAQASALLHHSRQSGGSIRMCRALAEVCEDIKRNTLGNSTGVIAGNKKVIHALGRQDAREIHNREQQIREFETYGMIKEAQYIESINNQMIVKKKNDVGGGCVGKSGNFLDHGVSDTTDVAQNNMESETSKWHGGKIKHNKQCRVCKQVKHAVGACDICETCVRGKKWERSEVASVDKRATGKRTQEKAKLTFIDKTQLKEGGKTSVRSKEMLLAKNHSSVNNNNNARSTQEAPENENASMKKAA